MNQNQFENPSSPKYIGVRKRKWGKYVSEIRLPHSRERIWLGSYDTAVKAARAFDAAQFCLRGNSGRLNFPHDPPEIPGGSSMTPAEIQAAAARFANSGSEFSQSGCFSSVLEESSQPSVSQRDFEMTDLPLEDAFMNEILHAGTENYYAHEFGLFSGYGELAGDFTEPAPPPSSSYVEYWPESNEETGFSEASSFLWNF